MAVFILTNINNIIILAVIYLTIGLLYYYYYWLYLINIESDEGKKYNME